MCNYSNVFLETKLTAFQIAYCRELIFENPAVNK